MPYDDPWMVAAGSCSVSQLFGARASQRAYIKFQPYAAPTQLAAAS
jgi:hypothetical protein